MKYLQDVDGERTTLAPEDAEAVDAVAALLGLAPPTAQRVLLERQINVRGNVTDIPLRLHEVTYLYLLSLHISLQIIQKFVESINNIYKKMFA